MLTLPLSEIAPAVRVDLTPSQYFSLLSVLVSDGEPWGKTTPIYAYPLDQRLSLVTLKQDGAVETEKNVKVLDAGLSLVFDAKVWPDTAVRHKMIRQMFVSLAKKALGQQDINQADLAAHDIWTIETKRLPGDYMPVANEPNLWTPDPGAIRITVAVDKDIRLPVQWGTFDVDAGGVIAVRKRDQDELGAALNEIAQGKISAEQALYETKTVDGVESRVSRFDVYGMKPGFRESSYAPLVKVLKSKAWTPT